MVKIKEMELFRQFNDWFERFKPELRRKFQIGSFFAWGLSIVIFFLGYVLNNIQGMFLSVLILFLTNLIFSLSNFSGRMAYTMFLSSFFCFMLGRMTMEYITSGEVVFNFANDISKHMLLVIFLALFSLQMGVIIAIKVQEININRHRKRENRVILEENSIKWLRLYTEILFYFSAICAISMNLEQIFFIQNYSYVDLYINFSSNIPRIMQIVGNMHIALFMLFIATCPSKKKCIFPFIFFSLITISVLGAGDRGTFVINIAVILVYAFWRQYHEKEVWISNKVVFVGIISLPFIFAGLSFWVFIREGIDVGEHSVFAQFVRFFRRTGVSVDILGYGKMFQEQFTQSLYSLGELMDYIKYNPLTETIFGMVTPKQYTAEYATTMHSFAHTISYFIFPDQYLLGHGKGSAYLAEIYQDFGYFGIVIWNIIYGIFLSWFENRKCNVKFFSPYNIAIHFMMLRAMFYIPRGPAIYPISIFLNITTIFVFSFIYIIVRIQKDKFSEIVG
ncbi:O-antigen polysaccharide polymerase Wzy family protein [Lachnospiraceae bacterium 56-18]